MLMKLRYRATGRSMGKFKIPQKQIITPSRPDLYEDRCRSHCNCIVCGSDNPISLKLKFELRPDGSVCARFRGNSLFQGYKGILHGGIISTLLDATMTHCLFYHGVQAVTGNLQVHFLQPVPSDIPLIITAKISSYHSVLYYMESELIGNKRLLSRGQAKFMQTESVPSDT